MEFLVVICVVVIFLSVSWLGVWVVWGGLFAMGVALYFRSRRTRCPSCRKHPIAIENVPFCNGCGKRQPETHNTRKKLFLWTIVASAISLALAIAAIRALAYFEFWLPMIFTGVFSATFVACFAFLKALDWVRLAWRCFDCGAFLRNEWNLSYCAHCGTAISPTPN